jgi:hypothetical protein
MIEMIELTALLSSTAHLAGFLTAFHPSVFLQNGSPDITTAVKTNLTTPILTMLQVVIPICVGLYVLYKVVGGHSEHAKMLLAEGVVVAAVLEGVLFLAKNLPGMQ